MRTLPITGVILAAVVLLASSTDAQRRGATASQGERAPFWPAPTGQPVVDEWYSDVPWHQKLGTFSGNEIDQPLVLPYDALLDDDRRYCKTRNLTPEQCMLEVGINNILGTRRIDTLYDPNDAKIKNAKECQDPKLPCIEVKLELSSFWTRSSGSGVALQPRPFGEEPPTQLPLPTRTKVTTDPNYYGGYAITDGSTYAPQLPWYVSHYCDAFYPASADVQDPVCYADYFSPMNDGFNILPKKGAADWPRSAPWSIWPVSPSTDNHCKKGETKCTMAMAGFDLTEVKQNAGELQYHTYNDFLLKWFNAALQNFKTDFAKDDRHFPWSGQTIDWDFIYPRSIHNPFLGEFESAETNPKSPPDCDPNQQALDHPGNCTNTGNMRATHYLYPRKCDLGDLSRAATGLKAAVDTLRQCGLNYELHHNGYWVQWPESFWPRIWCDKDACAGGPGGNTVGIVANQYGRTSFLFAGVPGMQAPVSFYKDTSGLSIYERIYNASIFSLYLPITNVSDTRRAFRNYTDTAFYHTLLMSNHMESDPAEFAEGIRGKVLWHDEYRTQQMYGKAFAPERTFAAAFKAKADSRPFHNTTCDGCHVRNGSGIPINTDGSLDPKLQEFMKNAKYNPSFTADYTFTGEIRPMKLVFFDLLRATAGLDASRYSEPLAFPTSIFRFAARSSAQGLSAAQDLYYRNKLMNFYGDSFHVTTPGYGYSWSYEPAAAHRMVVPASPRHNAELNKSYEPLQVKLGAFTISSDVKFNPPPKQPTPPWPTASTDIDNAAIHAAIDGPEGGSPEVGFMLLNGRRLGNLGAIEAIPNAAIVAFRESQKTALGDKIAGEIVWNAGSRDGVGGKVQKNCTTKSLADCYIGRFGWIGDRVSLEDQVANAAFVEMNITTTEGYKKLYPKGDAKFPIRYAHPNCGPANATCTASTTGNSDLSEKDVGRMAAYARWVGSPTRSEFQVSQPDVIKGEEIFRQVKCNTCHVIEKIEIDKPDDTMLSKVFRDRLATRVTQRGDRPFLSYLGTDLLMHDMGYLSQVGAARESIRDQDGVVKPEFQNYVQKIRTPALKGLRFNRYVTDSHRNTNAAGDPACDFLLHDGRACDAIAAAFLHDGPAIRKLGTIEALNALTGEAIRQLRAFLYSL